MNLYRFYNGAGSSWYVVAESLGEAEIILKKSYVPSPRMVNVPSPLFTEVTIVACSDLNGQRGSMGPSPLFGADARLSQAEIAAVGVMIGDGYEDTDHGLDGPAFEALLRKLGLKEAAPIAAPADPFPNAEPL